jgi:uncharacterized membrane protein HdeD (DUF308 family)
VEVKVGSAKGEVKKVVDMKDYYQTNKGRLLGIGGILIIVGLILYFARHQEVVLVLPVVGTVLFIAGVLYKPRKKADKVGSDAF